MAMTPGESVDLRNVMIRAITALFRANADKGHSPGSRQAQRQLRVLRNDILGSGFSASQIAEMIILAAKDIIPKEVDPIVIFRQLLFDGAPIKDWLEKERAKLSSPELTRH